MGCLVCPAHRRLVRRGTAYGRKLGVVLHEGGSDPGVPLSSGWVSFLPVDSLGLQLERLSRSISTAFVTVSNKLRRRMLQLKRCSFVSCSTRQRKKLQLFFFPLLSNGGAWWLSRSRLRMQVDDDQVVTAHPNGEVHGLRSTGERRRPQLLQALAALGAGLAAWRC